MYANPGAADEILVKNIMDSASNELGQEAFTSIWFSPKFPYGFYDMIKNIEVPICLIYGKEDPWIKPYFAERIIKTKTDATYYQVSPSGHCPHHETPTAVNKAIKHWIYSNEVKDDVNIKEEGDIRRMCEAFDEEVSKQDGLQMLEEVTGTTVRVRRLKNENWNQ